MGYTAPTKTPAVEQRQPSRLDTEVMAGDTLAEVPVTLATEPGKPENGSPTLNVWIHLDAARLKFDMREDRRVLKLTFVLAVLAPGGAFIAGRQGEIDLALKQATFDGFGDRGFNVTLPLQAPAGAYTLRGVVQEGIDGKISAASLPVELR
jgi:hypothetical protein